MPIGVITGNVRGSLFALAAAAVFTVASALVKIATKDYHVWEILLFRQLTMLVFVLPMLFHNFPANLKTKRPGTHLLRLISAFTALTLSFVAVAHLPLATAISFSFTKTLFASILAGFVLKETVGWRRTIAIVLGFAGILIILRPGLDSAASYYGLLATISALGAGLSVVCIRSMAATESTSTLLGSQAIFIAVLVVVPCYFVWKTPDFLGLVVLLSIGITSFLAQWLGMLSYRAGEISVVTGMEYSKLIYAVLIGIFVFSEWPDAATLLGALIIVGSSAFTIWRENRVIPRL
jgi:drug/metabolite transporter (DMT)-like permease